MDIEKLIESGIINNELDYQRAMVADRKLRLLAKTSSHFKNIRKKLRDLIADYEKRVWVMRMLLERISSNKAIWLKSLLKWKGYSSISLN